MHSRDIFPVRKRQRLEDYDYSLPGYYFITVNTKHSIRRFGEIRNGKMIPNAQGWIVYKTWNCLPSHYANIELDAFVLMPDHIHGIIKMLGDREKNASDKKTHPVSEIVRALKTFSARRINELMQTEGTPVWHRSFYDRIIRNERELTIFRRYIRNNPQKWQERVKIRGW